MDAEMMALSGDEVASRIARLTALDLCRARDLHFVADSVDQNKTTSKYLASLEEAKCEQLAWCVLVYNFTTVVRDTVSRITPGLARKWPHCVPGTRINIPIGADHFNAWDCLLSGLAYNTSLSMYPYCRFHAVSPGQAITISDFSTVDKGQLFSEFTAQIHAAADIYAGNNDQMHPFARICVETPRDCESEWREIARDILKSRGVEWLMPFIYFAPQVVDDTANHKLALSLMGPIETYASHEDMTNQHGSSGTAIITRFNPAVDTDDSYARDVVNGAKLYRKLAKPDLLWWIELQDDTKLYRHMSTVFAYFHNNIKYMQNVRFYTIGR